MVKLVENSFRDVNIAFANELSIIADKAGIDVWEVIALANRHPRVNILQPGPGVGGHCIAVDPWFIVHADPENARLIRTAREVNLGKTDHVLAKASDLVDQFPRRGHRVPRPRLQTQYRRFPRKPGGRNRPPPRPPLWPPREAGRAICRRAADGIPRDRTPN
ncbi:MAG: hypothetical protein LKM31_14110 [Sphingobium sp.]|jgi:hypothetical protein|nr:hypothetical protein [Sphingobium sp.]